MIDQNAFSLVVWEPDRHYAVPSGTSMAVSGGLW